MFSPEELRELEEICNLPNIYNFQRKFNQVSAPFREFYAHTHQKPKWMRTYDLCEQYEGLRDETIRRKRGIPTPEKLELITLLKRALCELSSPRNTRWYSAMSPDLFNYVLDKRLAR